MKIEIPQVKMNGAARVRTRGFTRSETLVVLGVLLLGLVVASKMAIRMRQRPAESVCAANMKRIVTAMDQYALDLTNYPSAARSEKLLPDDWIYWQTGRRLEESALATYMPGMSAHHLLCPLDKDTRYRLYPFSYTMNAHLERLSPARLQNKLDLILLYEEKAPNDGACVPCEPTDRLAERNRGETHAAFPAGKVELLEEETATQSRHVWPVLTPSSPRKP